MESKKQLIILSIAGSDNSSGAGIQADIKTSQALDAYCINCITCITSQNSKKVFITNELSIKLLISQIQTLMSEYDINCVKIGLLNNTNQAKAILKELKKLKKKIPIVVDPIYKSSTNSSFINKQDYRKVHHILSELNPIYTPNLYEARLLINSEDKYLSTEKIIKLFFNKYNSLIVVTNSGSEKKVSEDFFLDEKKKINKHFLKTISSSNTHGTGCTFSTALAIFLARGLDINKAVGSAKKFTRDCIIDAPAFNLDYGPLGHRLRT